MCVKQLLGILGSALLFVGVFTPIVSMPIVGSMNYFRNGEGEGVVVLLLAGLSLLLALTKNYRFLWGTGGGSFGVMIFTFYSFQSEMSKQRAALNTELAGNPFKELAEAAMQSIQLQWGWAVMTIGAVLIIAAAAIKKDDIQTAFQPSTNQSYGMGPQVVAEPYPARQRTKPMAQVDWAGRGKQHIKNNEYKEAVAAFSYAVKTDTNNRDIYYLRAVAYSKLADNIKSLEDIKTAARLGHPKAVDYLQKTGK